MLNSLRDTGSTDQRGRVNIDATWTAPKCVWKKLEVGCVFPVSEYLPNILKQRTRSPVDTDKWGSAEWFWSTFMGLFWNEHAPSYQPCWHECSVMSAFTTSLSQGIEPTEETTFILRRHLKTSSILETYIWSVRALGKKHAAYWETGWGVNSDID